MEINGVDTGALKAGLEQVTKDPVKGQFVFRATTTWAGGHGRSARSAISRSRPMSRRRSSEQTMPRIRWSRVLAALGGCLTVGISYMAALKGIQIDSIEIETEGDLDIRGFFGLEGVHPGYQQIRVRVHLECDAGRAEKQTLLDRVVETSPVVDIITRGIPVSVRLAA